MTGRFQLLHLACVLLWPVMHLHASTAFEHLGPVEILDNGVVVLEVAPKIGRIVAYHRKDEPNWLHVDDSLPKPGWHWNPWGGDRVWPTAQDLCPQIYKNNGFDPVIDGQPWDVVSKTTTSLEMRSGISPQLGLRITRRITLIGQTSAVEHAFVVERVQPGEFPVHVWTVTGVRAGDGVMMESDPRVQHADWQPFKWWREESRDIPDATLLSQSRVLHVPWPKTKLKLGTYGSWIALIRVGCAFRQEISYDPEAVYLESSSLQTYLAPEKSVFEIETLSPTWSLRVGEQRRWLVQWRLIDFPADAATPEQRARFLADQSPAVTSRPQE